MGLFNNHKRENEELKRQNEAYHNQAESYFYEIQNLKSLMPEGAVDKVELLNKLESAIRTAQDKISNLDKEIADAEQRLAFLKQDYIETDEAVMLQSFGLYKPMYDFVSSEQYKDKLESIRKQQAAMIKNETAATCSTAWTVNGDRKLGLAMAKDNVKQILRSFNTECDSIIDKVTFSNYESIKKRIEKTYAQLNKLNVRNAVVIQDAYLKLKYKELSLALEYCKKKEEEKEERRILREEEREAAKVQKEIEEKRKLLVKEQKQYEQDLKRVIEQLEKTTDEEKRAALILEREKYEANIEEVLESVKDVDYREANQRAGYVYVISNIGAFGEDVFKIGMTRRLEPLERVAELGDASVPFGFDVHAMIFSDDAPKLEAALQKTFDANRVNAINNRKEFFKVPLTDIEKVVKQNHKKTVDFNYLASAEQYRETLVCRESKTPEPCLN